MSPPKQKLEMAATAVSVGPASLVPGDLLLMALEQSPEAFILMDAHGVIEYLNAAFEMRTGYTSDEAVGQNIRMLVARGHEEGFAKEVLRTVGAGRVWEGSFVSRAKDGSLREEDMAVWPLHDTVGHLACLMSAPRGAGEEAHLDSRWHETGIVQAVGELATGLADELSAPSVYIGDNVRFLQASFEGIARLLNTYRELSLKDCGGEDAVRLIEIERIAREIGIDFLMREIPEAIRQTRDGVSQVADVARALKDFAHPDTEGLSTIDVNRAITSTIAVARNEWRYVANIRTELDPALPLVPGLPGAFNHVILNIIVDAAHAIEALLGKDPPNKGTITVETRVDGDRAVIQVSDTGTGIPQASRARVCGPFFAASDASRRTVYGLTAAHAVIVEQHHGSLELETKPGKGATFTIRLPLSRQAET
jgi:two-component system, NtrC family, sensor kinase